MAEKITLAAKELVYKAPGELIPYERNARKHDEANIRQLCRSLQEFGFVAPILIDGEGRVLAGHGRLMAAKKLKMREVPCVVADGLTDAQRRAYILADNRLAENSAWDAELLKIEMDEIKAEGFDLNICGWEVPKDWFESRTRYDNDGLADESEEYQDFVDKFEPKRTTDDCYTPDNIYETVKNWAVRRYGLDGCKILRPFYPGGDYQKENYDGNCVVLDNPPFSILSEIVRWYMERGIRFFLFAPGLTLFSIASGACNYVLACKNIEYENGADILSNFVTNLGEYKIELAPELLTAIDAADRENRAKLHQTRPNYEYPDNVITSASYKLAVYGQSLKLKAEDCRFIRALDAQKESDKAIFGGGFLLSEKAAAEKAAAEKAAAEKAAAEKAAAEKWALSSRELEIVRSLGSED